MTPTTDTKLFLVDSSGWIEYIGDGPKAIKFASFIEREESLLMPTIVLYEVYKKLSRAAEKIVLHRFLSHAFRAREVVLDSTLAIAAAQVSLDHGLAMADSIIYASAREHQALLITTDLDFQGLPGVFIP
ncbi:MAG: type II toxin-antitoxin system VapC family toxin [Candidatus Acidiferrales bacterium]